MEFLLIDLAIRGPPRKGAFGVVVLEGSVIVIFRREATEQRDNEEAEERPEPDGGDEADEPSPPVNFASTAVSHHGQHPCSPSDRVERIRCSARGVGEVDHERRYTERDHAVAQSLELRNGRGASPHREAAGSLDRARAFLH